LSSAADTNGVPFSRILTNGIITSTVLFGVARRDYAGAESRSGSEHAGGSRERVAVVLHLTACALSVPETLVGTMRSSRRTIVVMTASRNNAVSGGGANSARPLVTISVSLTTYAA